MNCQRCKSDRILTVGGKTNDLNEFVFKNKRSNDYVPSGLNIGAGDYIHFKTCLECGQIQGTFPVRNPTFYEEQIKGE